MRTNLIFFFITGVWFRGGRKKLLTKGFHPHVHRCRVCISRSCKDSTLRPTNVSERPTGRNFLHHAWGRDGTARGRVMSQRFQASIESNHSYPNRSAGENERLTGIRKERYQNPRPPLQQAPNSHQRSSPVADLSRVQDRETTPGHFLKARAC